MKPPIKQIFSINNETQFNEVALQVFHYQAKKCKIYKKFITNINTDTNKIKHYTEIPFLPVGFFKTHQVVSGTAPTAITFSSSGTTGVQTSKHLVQNIDIYETAYNEAFRYFYGEPSDYCILALLPSYLEREGSSLIYMVDDLIRQSKHNGSGYFLHNHKDLYRQLLNLKENKQKTILIGVTYALLDFTEKYQINFPELILMETGGMKGKRKELIRQELHQLLANSFGISKIHSEYGMTELLSQAYSKGDGIFASPPWMKVLLRDTSDPLSLITSKNTSGGINVIDLANIDSCAFIATQDLGKIYNKNQFEIIGRFDNAEIRGCNLLVQ